MQNKRSWPEITVDILETAINPTNKMRVMYRSNLNFHRFNQYFRDLLSKGLMEEIHDGNSRTLFRTTDRGRTLIAVLRRAEQMISEEDSE